MTRRCVTCFEVHAAESGYAGECPDCRMKGLRRKSSFAAPGDLAQRAETEAELDAFRAEFRALLDALYS